MLQSLKYEDFKEYNHARKYDHVMYPQARAEDKCRCVLFVPLLLKSIPESDASEEGPWRVIGVLKLENLIESVEHPEAYFAPRDVQIVEAYAAVIAVALEKAQMRADSIRIGAGLLEVSRSLLAELGERPPKLNEIVRQTAKAISAEACALWLRSGLQLRLEAAYGYSGSIQEVPPYQLETTASENAQTAGVGLTMYVAQTGMPLNLTTAEEVRNHFAWKGADDERMWNKPRGSACYSLVAIPLVDNETQDLMGVFKIENKKPTLFQLKSFFTKEDEQLLTILGNSIGFFLIMSERIDRLRRLERLVGDVRVLLNLDEALFFILTGLTHRDGLQYNRAMIFLVDEAKPNQLVCQFAIGQIDPADWVAEMDRRKDEPFLDLDPLVQDFRDHKENYLHNPMMERWKGRQVDTGNTDRSLIARHAVTLGPGSTEKRSTSKYLSGDLPSADMLSGFAKGDFVLIPITFEKKLKGIIYADNCFTGNRVGRFECEMLDLFAGMAGAIIQASGVPEKLQKERDEAWKTFSRPAAHRVGTEAGIIDSEAVLFIKRELDQAATAPGGRLAVRGEVIRNSLQVIQQAVNRLRLTAKDYQRLSAGAEDPEEFDLCELIDLTIKNTTGNFKGIKVESQCRDQPMWIQAARGGITYVIEELLINAWKQGKSDDIDGDGSERPEMRVCIDIRREQDSVICTVSDNGPGIPPALTSTLFQKPVRGRRGGTGLGLYICGQILKQNAGTIDLLTEGKPPGYDGACFRIKLPLDPSRRSEPNTPESEPTQRVLVVEDNPILRRHLSQVLAEKGFSSDVVQNENEAVKRVSTTLRAIIADINLSEAGGNLRGGILLAEQLAQMKWRIPIILISHDPWYYLPPKDSSNLRDMQEDYCIHSILDRNDPSFYNELVKSLRKATVEA